MKKKIALVTGGYSGESVVSYKSAQTIQDNLDHNLYDVYLIDINPEGWFYVQNDTKISVDKNDFTITIDNQKIFFDAVLIGMHGTPGEDGKLQGYFDILGIPYTGCNAATAALTFNKRYTVAVAKMAAISVANSIHLFKGIPFKVDEVVQELKFPIFVKPNAGGSSIGMSKVFTEEELPDAIEKAFKEDNQVLLEQMVSGREFTIGVYKNNGDITVLPITEVKANSDKIFFDFEAKYEGKSIEITPAEIDRSTKQKLEDAAKKIYAVFNCGGVVRIDFIYNENEQQPYMLEINTIPGQSAASIIPQQVKAMGGNLEDFYSDLIKECFNPIK